MVELVPDPQATPPFGMPPLSWPNWLTHTDSNTGCQTQQRSLVTPSFVKDWTSLQIPTPGLSARRGVEKATAALLFAFGNAASSTMLISVSTAAAFLVTRRNHLRESRRKQKNTLESVERSGFVVRLRWQTKDLKPTRASTTKSRGAPLLQKDESGTTTGSLDRRLRAPVKAGVLLLH